MTELQTAELPIAKLSPAEISQLEQLYTLREKSQVLEFIEKHPFLLPLLLEAPEKIKHYFPDTPLILEIKIDPEAVSMEEQELALYIASEIDPDESADKLFQFDRDGWEEVKIRSQEKLFINLGYE
ncbi:hypothetical protein PN499_16560 [Kamptonema animale CS-326]|jgi:hypothetical protein|uniref:hypothetical protein n=1 Tax=Kamptonema animale TaxID=92934 RepID=UPI00232C9A22|nr:hypothetical protein [Kamptonema animale]MDB9512802.1 hypothetical protein [Kamptonema animale CS-326]